MSRLSEESDSKRFSFLFSVDKDATDCRGTTSIQEAVADASNQLDHLLAENHSIVVGSEYCDENDDDSIASELRHLGENEETLRFQLAQIDLLGNGDTTAARTLFRNSSFLSLSSLVLDEELPDMTPASPVSSSASSSVNGKERIRIKILDKKRSRFENFEIELPQKSKNKTWRTSELVSITSKFLHVYKAYGSFADELKKTLAETCRNTPLVMPQDFGHRWARY